MKKYFGGLTISDLSRWRGDRRLHEMFALPREGASPSPDDGPCNCAHCSKPKVCMQQAKKGALVPAKSLKLTPSDFQDAKKTTALESTYAYEHFYTTIGGQQKTKMPASSSSSRAKAQLALLLGQGGGKESGGAKESSSGRIKKSSVRQSSQKELGGLTREAEQSSNRLWASGEDSRFFNQSKVQLP